MAAYLFFAVSFPTGSPAPAPEGAFWYDLVATDGTTLGLLAATMANGTRVLVAFNTGDAPVLSAALRVRASPGGPFRYANLTVPPHSLQTLTWEDQQ